jgi:hypothetical protein
MKTFKEFSKTNLVTEEAEGMYYKEALTELITKAQEIDSIITDDMELEAWVQDKITIAHHNMDAILGYLKSMK